MAVLQSIGPQNTCFAKHQSVPKSSSCEKRFAGNEPKHCPAKIAHWKHCFANCYSDRKTSSSCGFIILRVCHLAGHHRISQKWVHPLTLHKYFNYLFMWQHWGNDTWLQCQAVRMPYFYTLARKKCSASPNKVRDLLRANNPSGDPLGKSHWQLLFANATR